MGELWRLSWWDYHGFLLAGFGGAVYAIWARYRRTSAVDAVLEATFERDPMTHIVHGYPEALKTLVRAVEMKDTYTDSHSERTAWIGGLARHEEATTPAVTLTRADFALYEAKRRGRNTVRNYETLHQLYDVGIAI